MKYKPGKQALAIESLISLVSLLLRSREILGFLQHCALRDEAESCAPPYSVSQCAQNLPSALSFIIPFQNPLVLGTSKKSFSLPLKRQLRGAHYFIFLLVFVQNSANQNGSQIKGVFFLVKHKKILIFGPEAVDCHKQSAAKIINLCCLPNWY